MKVLLQLILLLGLCSYQKPDTQQVYICVSPTAEAYHKSKDGCKGIMACTHQVMKVSKEDAIKKYKYRACKICFR